MTQFIDIKTTEGRKIKLTLFTHELQLDKQFATTERQPNVYETVVYLGHCSHDGDMFAAYTNDGKIIIFKGEKGDEFND